MNRRLPTIAAALVAALTVTALIGASAGGAEKAKPAKAGAFRQALATKLGAQLDKPAEQVLAALKAAKRPAGERRERVARTGKPSKAQRAKNRAAAAKRQAEWSAAVAKSLGVTAEQVTAAVRALVKERLDSLVEDGWLTAEQRDKRLSRAAVGIAFLRKGL
jgi:hypothetical protein